MKQFMVRSKQSMCDCVLHQHINEAAYGQIKAIYVRLCISCMFLHKCEQVSKLYGWAGRQGTAMLVNQLISYQRETGRRGGGGGAEGAEGRRKGQREVQRERGMDRRDGERRRGRGRGRERERERGRERERKRERVCVGACWLLNIQATCECITGTDLLRQLYVLPH